MTAKEAEEKLKDENHNGPMTDAEYLECIEAQLRNGKRRAWRLEYLALREQHHAGVRPCADEALRRCQRKAGEAFAVGGASKWRSG